MYYKPEKIKIPQHQIEEFFTITESNFAKLDKSKKYILSFSCGKDSIVLLEMALKYGIKPIVYHQYIIEDLSFNKEVLGYYQSKGIEINLIESGMVAKMQKADLLCINKVLDIKGSKVNPLKKTEELIYELEKFDFNLIGIKQNDSPNRRMVINKHGWLHTKDKKAYPIYNWSDKMA